MKGSVTFLWIENPRTQRLADAQVRLEESVLAHGLEPLRFNAGRGLVLLGDVLRNARRQAQGSAIVWCNSDLTLTKNPFDVPDRQKVYGFIRREMPSRDMIWGVDMYYIPFRWWDDYLSKDVPKLYLGASYVDWWITRAMDKAGAYENLKGYIDHLTHPQSSAAASDTDPYYQKNFRAYNAWAKRNQLPPIPAAPYLIPHVGHVWGIRDAARRILK